MANAVLLLGAMVLAWAGQSGEAACLDEATRTRLKMYVASAFEGPPIVAAKGNEPSWAFRDGFLGFWRAKPSASPNADYAYNNGKQPYGIALLYPSNSTPAVKWQGKLADIAQWPVSEHEVVVLLGCTPRPSRYFSLTPYLMRTANGARTLAAIGDPLAAGATGFSGESSPMRTIRRFTRLNTSGVHVPHDQRVKFDPADGDAGSVGKAWDEDTVIIMSANPTAAERVAATFVAAGFPSTAINTIGISRAELGEHLAAPTRRGGDFGLYLRNALPQDPAAYLAYEENPPWAVFSLTPPAQSSVAQSSKVFPPTERIEARGFDEMYLESAADALARSAAERLRRRGGNGRPWHVEDDDDNNNGAQSSPTGLSGVLGAFGRGGSGRRRVSVFARSIAQSRPAGSACIATGSNCGLGNRDTVYSIAMPFFRLENNSSAVLLVGVRHEETGNAVYHNVVVNEVSRRLGVIDAHHLSGAEGLVDALGLVVDEEVGRALPMLYALVVARSCANLRRGLQCVEVPSTGFPSAPLDATLSVWERAYAALASSVGPPVDRLVLPRLVVPAPATTTGLLAGPVGDLVEFGARIPGARSATNAIGSLVGPAGAAILVNNGE